MLTGLDLSAAEGSYVEPLGDNTGATSLSDLPIAHEELRLPQDGSECSHHNDGGDSW